MRFTIAAVAAATAAFAGSDATFLRAKQSTPVLLTAVPPDEAVYWQQLNTVLQPFQLAEGYIMQEAEEQAVYRQLASQPWVKTICETGFNAGHSSLLWLLVNPQAKVYSFDLGQYGYTHAAVAWMQKTFPGRLNFFQGDSTHTVPEVHRTQPDVKCDLLVVDGGHTVEVARADLENFRHMAAPQNIMVVDDTPCGAGWCVGPYTAWNEAVVSQRVIPVRIRSMGESRGFSTGVYMVDGVTVPVQVPGAHAFTATSALAVQDVTSVAVEAPFWSALREVLRPYQLVEGYIMQEADEQAKYRQLASQPWVKTICETGFNAGHSTLLYLLVNPQATVYSFDLGQYGYTHAAVKWLQKTFPGRVHFFQGDSTKTVPEVLRTQPNVKCDLAIVDGGHSTEVARADIGNFRAMSAKKNLMVVDDTPCYAAWCTGPYAAWNEAVSKREVRSVEVQQLDANRGFSVGTYLL